MTIDTRTGRPVIYICPECKKETGFLLFAGHCVECEIGWFDVLVTVERYPVTRMRIERV